MVKPCESISNDSQGYIIGVRQLIWDRGVAAYRRGVTKEQCPYDGFSNKWTATVWRQGWEWAQEQDQGNAVAG